MENGMNRKRWTDEELLASAKKYETVKAWTQADRNALQASRIRGPDFYAKCTSHMERIRIFQPIVGGLKQCSKCDKWLSLDNFRRRKLKTVVSYRSDCRDCSEPVLTRNKKWTEEEIFEIAKKYKHKHDFYKNDRAALGAAQRRGIEGAVCAHMIPKEPYFKKGQAAHNKKWTAETLQEEALKYKYKKDFWEKSGGAATAATNLGLFEKITSHMEYLPRGLVVYSYEQCKSAAQLFSFRKAFKSKEEALYRAAERNGWLNDICSHRKRMSGIAGEQAKIYNMIKNSFPDTVLNKWITQNGSRFQLDIFIPSLMVAIEYDGLYWQANPERVKKDVETNFECANLGINLIRISDKAWKNKRDEQIKRINALLGVSVDPSMLECSLDIKFFNKELLDKASSFCDKTELRKKDKHLYENLKHRNLLKKVVYGKKQ